MASEITRKKLEELQKQIDSLIPIVEAEELTARQLQNIAYQNEAERRYNEKQAMIKLDKKYREMFKAKHEKEICDAIRAELYGEEVISEKKEELMNLEAQAKKLIEADSEEKLPKSKKLSK